MTRIRNNRPNPEPGPMPNREQPPKAEKKSKRLRAVSKKRAVLNALCAPTRKQFLEDWPNCMVCQMAPSVDVHEIARGAAREHVLGNTRLLMSLCRACHDELGNTKDWPAARQIAKRYELEIGWAVADYQNATGREAPTTADVLEYMKLIT